MSQPTLSSRLCSLPVRRPKATLAALFLLSGIFGAGILRLQFDPTTERVFPDGHWAVTTYREFQETFGGDEAVFIAVEVTEGEVFAPEVLQLCRRMVAFARQIDGVENAFSLPDVPVLRLQPLGGPRLVPGLPEDLSEATPETLARWRGEVLATPLVDGVLVSADRKATTVAVMLETLDPGPDGAQKNLEIVAQLQALAASIEREPGAPRLHLAGSPLIKAEVMQAIQGDSIRFTGPLLLIAMLAAVLVLRSVKGMLLVVATLVVSADLTLGAMGHLGIPLDPMSTLVPVLLLVIGVADSLHLLVEQRAQAARLPEADGATTILAALEHVAGPCFLTSFTTAIGFGSLVTSPIPPIRSFGVAAAMAAVTAFAVTMVLIPACAALLAPPSPRPPDSFRPAGSVATWVLRRPVPSLVIGGAVVIAGLVGWQRIRLDTDFLHFFPDDSTLVRDVERIQELFVGVAPCEMLVSAPPGSLRRPAALEALLAFERGLEASPIVDLASSAADLVVAGERLRTGQARIPPSEAELDQVRALLESLAWGQLPIERLIAPPGPKHPDAEWLRVTVRARAVGSERFAALIDRVHELSRRHLEPLGMQARPTGTSVVFSQTADTIMSGQITSFLWAFGLITLVLTCALRSVVLGLLSIVPNIVPIAALLGAMGYLDIPLNSFNSMVASVAIGIAVDDTIHILSGFKRFSRELPLREAVQETIAHEGTALLSTSTVLFCGFSVLLLASFSPTAHFGLLTAIAIVAALVGDLLLVPAMLILIPRRRGAAEAAEATG